MICIWFVFPPALSRWAVRKLRLNRLSICVNNTIASAIAGTTNAESPRHTVTLDAFWIDQTEITNAQYHRCVDAGICTEPAACIKGEPTYADPDKADHPVVCVDWEDAQSYCQWVGGRLPTEAEWEYAFRGDAGSIYPWGDEFDGSRLNYCDVNCSASHADSDNDDGFQLTAPAGSFSPGASWSGSLNMGGNVSEWVADWLGEYAEATTSNPKGPSSGSEKLVKGCNWFFHPTYCRGAVRASVNPDTRFDYLGFRCATPATPQTEAGDTVVIGSKGVPSGDPPTIDGILESDEWERAAVETLCDGSELLFTRADDYLYLGIRSITSEMIGANIYLEGSDQINILHTSAALGTAIYRQEADSWQQIQDFDWRCRDTANSADAQAERSAYLQENHWLAANSRIGASDELEVQIKLTDDLQHLAVSMFRSSTPDERAFWPPTVDDDCIKPFPGGLPTVLQFTPEHWATLQVSR